jgi:hypothetical protein
VGAANPPIPAERREARTINWFKLWNIVARIEE